MEANSPAALAGLQPHSDYIVGADQVLQDVSILYYPYCMPSPAVCSDCAHLQYTLKNSYCHTKRADVLEESRVVTLMSLGDVFLIHADF